MKNLYFIRHGQSEMNVSGHWSGVTDTPLTPKGHEQAKRTGAQAKKDGLSVDVIISSPLQRAHHTAKHVATALDFPHENIMLHQGFIERNYGAMEATVISDDIKASVYDETILDSFEGSEKLIDLQWRARQMVDYLHSLPYETILVVSHGTFGRALRRAIEKTSVTERGTSIANAEIVKFL